MWDELASFCAWAILETPHGDSGGSATREHLRVLRAVQVAAALGSLVPLCTSLQAAASQNCFSEETAQQGSALWRRFEDLLCLLLRTSSNVRNDYLSIRDCPGMLAGVAEEPKVASGDSGNPEPMDMDGYQKPDESSMLPPPPYPGVAMLPLVTRLSSAVLLPALASLTAGWLHRCHSAGLSPWPLAVERYGVLAGVTAGALVAAAVQAYRPAAPRAHPSFGRKLFCALLAQLLALPAAVEGDSERGHRWLQSAADLAFEDERHLESLQLHLQAGALKTAGYCDPSVPFPSDVFTPWVVRRMITSLRILGANLQAVALCQVLPAPALESAFHILQESSLIGRTTAEAYLPCIWE
eukprot:SM000001S04763  [mRNA]  locus=s1:2050217:2052180:- [translate_table: standard]